MMKIEGQFQLIFQNKMFKNLRYFYIILFLLFFFFNYSNVFGGWISSATCTDGSSDCGYLGDLSVIESCLMSGSDIYGGIRILGGQICYTVGGEDNGGYYMIGTSEPNSNTQIYPFGSSWPWNWVYNKSSGILRNFGGSYIPTDVFKDGIYYNLKFFNPIPVNVTFNQPDDSGMLQIGSNYIYWTGCNTDPRDVYSSNCPSKNFVGPTNFNARPGDYISFKIENHLRPNNGYGDWGSGSAQITFGNLTVCYTSAYFDYITCGSPGCSGRPNYIPTAPGVCSPETKPKANLNVYWKDTGTPTKEITINFGENIPNQTFVIENNGELNSKLRINSCNPSVGWISVLNCPIGVELSFDDFKNSIISLISNLKVKL